MHAGSGRKIARARLRLSRLRAIRKRAQATMTRGLTRIVKTRRHSGQDQATATPKLTSKRNQRLARKVPMIGLWEWDLLRLPSSGMLVLGP